MQSKLVVDMKHFIKFIHGFLVAALFVVMPSVNALDNVTVEDHRLAEIRLKVESVGEKFDPQFQHTKWVLAASLYDLTLYSLGYFDNRQILCTVAAFTLTAIITSYYVIQLFVYGWKVFHIIEEADRARWGTR